MLTAADIRPITAAIDDQSAEVRRTALRVIGLLLPLTADDHLYGRLQVLAESSDADGASLATAALRNASQARSPVVAERTGRRNEERAVTRLWGSPEEWRETFAEATSVLGRLYPALSLAAIGENTFIESVLEEIESGPLNMDALGYVRWEAKPLPPAGAERLLRIANDTARRGDVRQIAWHLARTSVDAGERPCTQDLTDSAADMVDRYMSSETGVELRRVLVDYLDTGLAALLITVLFERCLRGDGVFGVFDDGGYMAGNDVVTLVPWPDGRFLPDIPALFELYLEAFQHASKARADWYRTRDDNVVYSSGSGHLAVGWQIAWTVARAGLLEMIADLATFLESPDEEERLAALSLLEDAIRYLGTTSPPLFGGVSAPETEPAVLVQNIRSTLTPVSSDRGYKTVRVFYGTNRQPTGSTNPGQWFGVNEADLALGVCEVTVPVPPKHQIGNLESPSWYTVIHRLDPTRYVILQEVKPQSELTFCETLRNRVHSSKDKHALVFVHGYRVSFEDAARRAAQLSEDLGIAIPLFYSWPSKARLHGYGADETLAQRAVPVLLRFLDLVSAQSDVQAIHLIAHSMGSLALSRAIGNYLEGRTSRSRPVFREIILAAPDIDAEIFKNEIAPKIVGKGPRLTLYASRRDYALLTSRWLRCGLSRAGFIEGGKPLVVRGVETIDVSAVNTERAWGLLRGHSYLADRPAVLQDMFELLRLGKSAGERFGNQEQIVDNLPYWIMKPRVA